jgi:hypothetical protein
LINLDGKPLLAGTISPQHDSSVNLTGLKNGIYILRLQNKGKNTSVKIIRNAPR